VYIDPVTYEQSTSITSYTVTSNPGGITASGTTSPITMTGIDNNTTYTFTVTANNAAGAGTPSEPTSPVTTTANYIDLNINGDFTTTINLWLLGTANGGTGALTRDVDEEGNAWLKLDVTSTGASQDYGNVYAYSNLAGAITKSKVYRLTFKAKSTAVNKSFEVLICDSTGAKTIKYISGLNTGPIKTEPV